MSAVVLGKRNSSYFSEELNRLPPFSVSKKARLKSSPASEPELFLSPFEHLRSVFPEIEEQVLVKELEACGNDIDFAIINLEALCCKSMKENVDSADGPEWIDRLVSAIMKARNIADARACASSMLKDLGESMMTQATIKETDNIDRVKENMILKEQVEVLLRDNNILKRAVAIQHERQKELQMKTLEGNQEIQHLKQLVGQYQQQIQTLEINNYGLSMHLRQAQRDSSMPTRFHPDVF